MTQPSPDSSANGQLCYVPPAIPANERERQAEVLALNLMDTPPEERFDRIVRLARVLFNVPISYVSLIYQDRQYFKSRSGIEETGTSREVSMCGHAILQDEAFVITDARKDHRFANNPLVIGDPFVRFYAGQALRGPHGLKVGTLCIIDRLPRKLEEKDRALLKELTALIERELALGELIHTQAEAIRAKDALAASELALKNAMSELEVAKQQAEEMLHSVLPQDVASELRDNGTVTPVRHEEVAVLFTDFAGFTKVASTMEASDLVEELNECFCHFDWAMGKHGVEKLKTIGDGYLAVAGIPQAKPDDAMRVLRAAIEIRDYMKERKAERAAKGLPHWDLRIGLHLGPLVAGVVGVRKIAYDVWGDTVNTASRIETAGAPGRINVSGAFYERVKEQVVAESRGKIDCKNKGEVEMYFVDSIKS